MKNTLTKNLTMFNRREWTENEIQEFLRDFFTLNLC